MSKSKYIHNVQPSIITDSGMPLQTYDYLFFINEIIFYDCSSISFCSSLNFLRELSVSINVEPITFSSQLYTSYNMAIMQLIWLFPLSLFPFFLIQTMLKQIPCTSIFEYMCNYFCWKYFLTWDCWFKVYMHFYFKRYYKTTLQKVFNNLYFQIST